MHIAGSPVAEPAARLALHDRRAERVRLAPAEVVLPLLDASVYYRGVDGYSTGRAAAV
jgi:hypothetical protein